MFTELDWWGYLIIAALPLIGFVLGFRWARENPAPPRPFPPEPETDSRLIDVVSSVQRQLEELAERQEFTERLLAGRREQPAAGPRESPRIPTPV
jgi:hypothetical protein